MPTFVAGPVTVSVPASSANLGPGFDALGLALHLRDSVTAEVVATGGGAASPVESAVEIAVSGAGEGVVPLDESHLVYSSMRSAFGAMDCEVPGIRLYCRNMIPHGRGLGSSSAAIVAGICLARALVPGGSLLLDDEAVFCLAAQVEGHPDNVAPAVFGGFTIAYADSTSQSHSHFAATRLAVDPRVQAVVFVPPEPVRTQVARDLLPETVPHAAAAANAGRSALLVAAIQRRPELLFAATEDRLHQDYREVAMPETLRLVRELRADRLPAVVSGAGPTVLVLTDTSRQEEVARRCPAGWQVLRLSVDQEGARLEARLAASPE
jgi:homoserine kinase